MHASNPTLQRYLQRHTEPLARQVAHSTLTATTQRYDQAVVVPLYNEATDCLGRVFRQLHGTNTLVIAVVNAPADAPAPARLATRQLLDGVAAGTPLAVLTVDCFSTALDAKSAVGEARKIGTDIALYLHLHGRVRSPWLYQTDADAHLPENYFAVSMPHRGAVVFAHRHVSRNRRLQQAADLYDRHMAYYTAGLKAAGSSYAYPSLGSTISVHAHSYAAVRGFPKRNAAEDFYLLNKVAKVHGVHYQPAAVIELAARLSARVPFGTGPALRDISRALDEDPSGALYLSYHPASFLLLGEALDSLQQIAQAAPDQMFEHPPPQSDHRAATLLEALRFDRLRKGLTRQNSSSAQRQRVCNEWFDAGRTLRFVHAARQFHPDQPLLKTLQDLPDEIGQHLN